jgi:hypothetical protein
MCFAQAATVAVSQPKPSLLVTAPEGQVNHEPLSEEKPLGSPNEAASSPLPAAIERAVITSLFEMSASPPSLPPAEHDEVEKVN